jgi:hypothetical protein
MGKQSCSKYRLGKFNFRTKQQVRLKAQEIKKKCFSVDGGVVTGEDKHFIFDLLKRHVSFSEINDNSTFKESKIYVAEKRKKFGKQRLIFYFAGRDGKKVHFSVNEALQGDSSKMFLLKQLKKLCHQKTKETLGESEYQNLVENEPFDHLVSDFVQSNGYCLKDFFVKKDDLEFVVQTKKQQLGAVLDNWCNFVSKI